MRFYPPHRKNERGVTILIVGLTLLALIAMATLAIDIASLYVVRNEAQRAADAAALAGAKMFVTSSFTSRPASWSTQKSALCTNGGPGSSAAVNQQAALVASANLIAGQPGVISSVNCNFDDSDANTNPRVTVTVQTLTAPIFFARIFGINSGMVTASATAEAYNMSGHPIPVQLTGVKPWLIPNCNPNAPVGGGAGNPNCPAGGGARYDYFINPDGTLKNPSTYVGRELNISRVLPPASPGVNGGQLRFYGLDFPAAPAPICPAASAPSCGSPVGSGANTYVDNLACSSQLPMRCGERIGTGHPIVADSDAVEVATSPTTTGTQCLIHSEGNNNVGDGQDSFTPFPATGPPITITGGTLNPDLSLRGVTNISRSDSVVTVPVDNGNSLCPPGGCAAETRVIGFLQLGIHYTTGGALVPTVILNAVGCDPDVVAGFPDSSANAISPGSVSPIIVRLVQTPTP